MTERLEAKTKPRRLAIVFSSLLLTACSQTGQNGAKAVDWACEDASGVWSLSESLYLPRCQRPNLTKHYTHELIQQGCLVTVKGTQRSGIVRDNYIYWRPDSYFDQMGASMSIEASIFQVLDDKQLGKSFWTFSDGIQTCSGISVITAHRR